MSHWRPGRFLPIVLVGLCVLAGCEERRADRCTVELGGHRLEVEVAITDDEQELGLMYRDHLDENHGMLFVYDDERPLRFWMKDTRIPLSIAFIGADGVVSDIQDMKPLDRNTTSSKKPAMYALEANQGWFRKHGIAVGDRATFSPKLKALIAQYRQEK